VPHYGELGGRDELLENAVAAELDKSWHGRALLVRETGIGCWKVLERVSTGDQFAVPALHWGGRDGGRPRPATVVAPGATREVE
jgi:hypothetical protein